MFYFITSSKLIIFVSFYYIVTFNHFFSLTRPLLVPYAHVSIESIDCILLSSFELRAIVLISSAKILCLSLLNICHVFNINLSFFYEFFIFSFVAKETTYVHFIFFYIIYFILNLRCFQIVFIIFKFSLFL